ncbi:group II intron reverse transcriptase/maturase [Thalassobacillus sp. C254]|uniref:group II intron reverse transcriptase/maturase n=1 Tax=Thalassobacillus sp. C254 TaxID=1225341 RepID=UPI0006D16D2E|nr:group II intron reverse transcriptase/maturase [Thalassobacillus sp. C254]
MLKKTKLRHIEYYDMQKVYDGLYSSSQNGNNFYKLSEMIGSEQNIRLAYRNLKTNKGSKTTGTDGLTIKDLWHLNDQQIVLEVRRRLIDYQPGSVRRVWIPKEGSDQKRPLGIPPIWDRLIQQAILQVLEPICEAKFHPHSYGFRPNRSAHHAFSRMVSLVNIGRQHYCVDIDIKGFFDNVDHGKLLKQLWSLGIRDKSLLCIISKLLKAPIQNEGSSEKGTPQGGILSPLLSNIVLNELDWWISSQWETYRPHRSRSVGFRHYARKYTNLKTGYLVRYADDFKIMCRTYQEAKRFYYATVDFLKSRLGLDINEQKSNVVNLKRNASEFLGFKLKIVKQRQARYGYIAKTSMSDKSVMKTKNLLKDRIKEIQQYPTTKTVQRFNTTLIGIQHYFRYATTIYTDLTEVNYILLKSMKSRLKNKASIRKFSETSFLFKKKTRGIRPDTKVFVIQNTALLPVTGVHHKNPWNFSQHYCNYTEEGRKGVHTGLQAIPKDVLVQVMHRYSKNRSIEYNDNRISKYVAQYGKCYITGEPIGIDRVHCHHIIPLVMGGTDHYSNLVIIDRFVHKLIHVKRDDEITKYLRYFQLDKKQLEKLNVLRSTFGNEPIIT